MDAILVREIQKEDENFVLSTWFNSYKSTNKRPHYLLDESLNKVQRQLLKNSRVFVASSLNEKEIIYGYVIASDYNAFCVIHWIYVKSIYRGLGIGKKLFQKAIGDKKHLAYTMKSTKLKAPIGSMFVPELIHYYTIKGD